MVSFAQCREHDNQWSEYNSLISETLELKSVKTLNCSALYIIVWSDDLNYTKWLMGLVFAVRWETKENKYGALIFLKSYTKYGNKMLDYIVTK